MIEVQAPNNYAGLKQAKVFLAGSIEMGKAENWQSRLANDLSDLDIVLLNPRRDDWDSTWEQKISNPNFKEQVDWEHSGLMNADIAVFYFDPNTMSPITLMELGLMVGLNEANVIVCCPDGYWRKGNVEYICKQYRIGLYNDYESFVEEIRLNL
jgi:hypothetical protein